MGQKGFWDWENRHAKLSNKKILLDQIDELIPWEEFRPILKVIHQKPRLSNAGRKPLDTILMFKLIVLQKLFNLGDDELEYQANDRLSFMKFLHLGLEDSIPDAKTVWLFREQLTQHGLIEELFNRFDDYLRDRGYEAEEGQIVDATLVPVPKQRNSQEENDKIRQGETPEGWEKNPHRLSQKDLDARWTKKNGQSYYGYKNHISIDVKFGFVRSYHVTDASVHDSKALGKIIDGENLDDRIWGDSAYRSEDIEWVLEQLEFDSKIHERAYRNKPLSEEQKSNNRQKSKIRAKVEHVFGAWVMSMGGKLLRSIGKIRANANIGLKNLAYNIRRYIFWETQKE
ncbi:IS5 family transposase [Baaleninema simplex]|uniref:IS5 family transposase n=1 Tax=Baaleninema simplex TaxID=2862350 RepID=UPI00034AE170|nr:IS5 family transposase [Baaleninema simplex]